MKIGVATPVWGRLKTTTLWWQGFQRLKRQWGVGGNEVQAFVCGSEVAQKGLCEVNGGVWIDHPNELGAKFNNAVEAAWKWGADYVVILGSDDLVSPKLAEQYGKLFQGKYKYFGLKGCNMIEPPTQRALYLAGHASPKRYGETIGAGRVLSKEVLDKVNGRPWPENLKRGADLLMTLRLRRLGVAGVDLVIEPSNDAFLLDVKGGGNLWKFDGVTKYTHVTTEADYESLLKYLPEDEQAMIRELEHAHCPTCGHLRPW